MKHYSSSLSIWIISRWTTKYKTRKKKCKMKKIEKDKQRDRLRKYIFFVAFIMFHFPFLFLFAKNNTRKYFLATKIMEQSELSSLKTVKLEEFECKWTAADYTKSFGNFEKQKTYFFVCVWIKPSFLDPRSKTVF